MSEQVTTEHLSLDGRCVPLEGERNLLEVARKAGVEIPTFCYHSELSVYGACRLCLVDIEGRGIVTSCSTPPEPGMVVRTHTQELRRMRRVAIELFLANHEANCPTCSRSASCKLQDLARRLGVDEQRFRRVQEHRPLDLSSVALVRDPNKCVLCGDCVRTCREVQSIGAIDFAHRGHDVVVTPAFGKGLGEVECVDCGQCAAVCPVGAILPRSEVEAVWAALDRPDRTVVVSMAPAVRVALGEHFGLPAGRSVVGQLTEALRRMGFAKVYDTAFAADLTVVEEAEEFIDRVQRDERLPQLTSCCPAWVKMAEQSFPELLPRLSTCRSPQAMLGSMARRVLPAQLGVAPEQLVVVSIMPCTAKKAEARRPELAGDVDHVITTQELARMIEEAGLDFPSLPPASLDLPLGFKTGAGVLFGASGGVSEAVLRYAAERLDPRPLGGVEFAAVRGREGLRSCSVTLGGRSLRLAQVSGLANARALAEEVVAGTADYDFIEVMACPGGCVGGAGQPVSFAPERRTQRAQGLYDADRMLQLHKSQDNPMVAQLYDELLGEPGSPLAHQLLHTTYHNRRRILEQDLALVANPAGAGDPVTVRVCVGTGCHVRGSQRLLTELIRSVDERDLAAQVEVSASFCVERCDRGPSVVVGDQVLEHCTLARALEAIEGQLAVRPEVH